MLVSADVKMSDVLPLCCLKQVAMHETDGRFTPCVLVPFIDDHEDEDAVVNRIS